MFLKWLFYQVSRLHKSCTNISSVCYEKCPQCVFLYTSEGLRGAEKKLCWGSQASLSVRIAVRGQHELLTVCGAVLLFPQWLQLRTPIGQSILLLPLNMSFEQSKAWNTQEEGDCPQAKRQAQVHDPAERTKEYSVQTGKESKLSHNFSLKFFTNTNTNQDANLVVQRTLVHLYSY